MACVAHALFITCLAKKISRRRESLTIEPWGSSPGRHLYRKISPCTGLVCVYVCVCVCVCEGVCVRVCVSGRRTI